MMTASPTRPLSRWYRIISNNPLAQPEPTSREQREQVTLRLAEAEAQVERTIEAERDHLAEMQARFHQEDEGVPLLDRVLGRSIDFEDHDTLRVFAQNADDPFLAGAARLLARSSPTRPAAMRKTMKTLTRYRREAESARRRAFAVWLGTG